MWLQQTKSTKILIYLRSHDACTSCNLINILYVYLVIGLLLNSDINFIIRAILSFLFYCIENREVVELPDGFIDI